VATVTELVTIFSFVGSTQPLKIFNTRLGKSILLLSSMTTAVISSGVALTRWTAGILNSLDPLVKMSTQLKINAGYIQEMSYAATQAGSSVSAMQRTIMSLESRIGSASLKGDSEFSRWGLSIRRTNGQLKSADELLEDIRKRLNQLQLSPSQRKAVLESLGVDPSLLELLGKTNSEIKQLREESQRFNILTGSQLKQVEVYSRSVQKLRFAWDGLKQIIAVGVAPAFERLSEQFLKIIDQNRDWIINVLGDGLKILGDFIAMLDRMKWVLFTVGAVFIGINAEVALLIAGITSLIALADDIIQFFKGGDSAIGTIWDAIKGWFNTPLDPRAWGISTSTPPNNSVSTAQDIDQNITINIQEGAPREVADAVVRALQRQLNDAQDQALAGGV